MEENKKIIGRNPILKEFQESPRKREEDNKPGYVAKDSDAIKFEIEITLRNLNEAQKKRQTAFNLALVLYAMLVIIMISTGDNDKVTIPFIGVPTNKWFAAEILTVLASVAYYRMFTMHSYSLIIGAKFAKLLKKQGYLKYPFTVDYPTLYGFFQLSIKMRSRFLSWPFFALIFALPFIFPIGSLIFIFTKTEFSFHWLLTCVISLLFIIVPLKLYRLTNRRSLGKTLELIEE